jgi:Fic family protein
MMSWEDFRVHKRLQLNPERVEAIYQLIAAIDGVKNSWQITAKLLPQTIHRLTHSVIVTSTGASNRIEGNQLTDVQVESLYRNLRIKKFKTRDEQEVAGYLSCLEMVFNHHPDIPLTESSILKLHHDMLIHSDKDSRHKGSYST